ncbi:MAG: hypothetical protein ABID87_03360 [Chloroflexota bacterium]
MEIEFGAKVIDLEGKVLGKVDYLIRDTWTGEISKFIVRRQAPDTDLFLTPGDVGEASATTVKLKVSAAQISQR